MTRGTVREIATAAPAPPARRGHRWLSHLRREVVAVPVVAVLLAAGMTWPTLRHPTTTLPEDLGDPSLIAYMLAWGGHALRTDPARLWDANVFYPERTTLAFTDSFLGYAPLGLLGTGPDAAVLRYNILFVLVAALAFVGAYALARQLGARWQGAAVAGAAFAYAPWRWSQAGHLQVLSTGGIALALALLARGHGYSFRHGYRPEQVKPGWAAAGWAVASWQVLIGFGIGLPFAYAVAVICLVAGFGWWFAGRPRLPRRLVVADAVGALAFAAVGLLSALPYLRVIAEHPYARRSAGQAALYSPPLQGFFIAPDDSLLWGQIHEAARATLEQPQEKALLPGVVLLALALAGLRYSSWSRRQRIGLAGAGAVALVLALGTQAPGGGAFTYLPLLDHAPGWDALRTPGRLVIWVTLVLCLLAAGAVTAVVDNARDRPAPLLRRSPVLRFALVVPVLLVLAEGLNTTPHDAVPPVPAALASAAGPTLVLPSTTSTDSLVMLWTTGRYPSVVNGTSGFTPYSQQLTREVTRTFPDHTSVAYLRQLEVRTVVVLPDRLPGTEWAEVLERPVDGLGVDRRTVGNAVVFTLRER
jgi:hypothetical protein